MTEREEVDAAVSKYRRCLGAEGDGCACMGEDCLGHHLADIRRKYDGSPQGWSAAWWSDQGHCFLKKREGDSGRPGAPLNGDNYWSGAK